MLLASVRNWGLCLASVLLLQLLLPAWGKAEDTDGLYLRTYFAFNQLQNSTFYLQGDRIAWNPTGGIDPFDFDEAEKSGPTNVGHFKISGDTMEVTWGGDRGKQTWRIERQDGKMSALDGGLVSKVGAYKQDQTLNATFGGALTAGGANGITASRSITFTDNGKFTLSTAATAEQNPNVIGANGAVSNSSGGSYTLSGNTLTLTFDDGKTEKHTVFPYSTTTDSANAKLDDEKLFFDTQMLSRER
ncbi:MAG: hypothetical protein QM770_24150 [Tepidisphaeraceae bacterium]